VGCEKLVSVILSRILNLLALGHFPLFLAGQPMLVSFTVENFRSIGEEVTLNMIASNKFDDHENHLVPIGNTGKSLLRAGVIYGANAAGKTNLVKAIDFAQKLILDPNTRNSYVPFRFRAGGELQPGTFEFRMLIDERVFVYGFDIQGGKIISEWLSVLRNEDQLSLFERDSTGIVTVTESTAKQFDDDRTFKTLNSLKELPLRPEQLCLNRALGVPENAQGKTLRSILKWFTSTLLVLDADARSADLNPIFDRLSEERFKHFCSRFLNFVGTGVGALDVVTKKREGSEMEKKYLPRMFRQRTMNPFGRKDTTVAPIPGDPDNVLESKLVSEHHILPDTYYLPFSEESDGTQSLLPLLPILAAPHDQSMVVVIDELDRSLHPLLCWEFVKFFSESCPGAHRQLIATTHEAHLLNQELLRRDEYWFVEKDEKQQTRLVSLDNFKIRNDLKIEKGYLQGRFGAIPLIGGMEALEEMLSCSAMEGTDAEKTTPS
jgi:hypothetical protein